MASPSGGLRPSFDTESIGNEEEPPVSSRRDSSSSTPRPDLDQEQTPCHWKTTVYHDQECSRYFDCPSHTIERRISVDEHGSDDDTDPMERDTVDNAGSSRLSQEAGVAGDGHRQISQDVPTPSNIDIGVLSMSAPLASPLNPDADDIYGREGSPPTEEQRSRDTPSSFVRGDEYEQQISEPTLRTPRYASRELDLPREDVIPERGLPPLPPLPPFARSRYSEAGSEVESRASSEFVLPRWQPDAEVTLCPICHTQFSIFVRKHHCRKCGRVVCNSCSPHRIIIPHQYIVRPPGSEMPVLPQTLLTDQLGVGYFDVNGMPGGERVRLCNPCVPDPNTAPPQSLTPSPVPPMATSRSTHTRSRSSLGNAYEAAIPPSNRYGMMLPMNQHQEPFSSLSTRSYRNRSVTVTPGAHVRSSGSSYGHGSRRSSHASSIRFSSNGSSLAQGPALPLRYSSYGEGGSSSRHRQLPPTPQIAEEDECPVCHRELPSRDLENSESLREAHITSCIQSHSAYGSPGGREETSGSQATPRLTGMYTYPATEKDCVDDAECTICLEEFVVGVGMARLECLCRFHRSCIVAWFVNHPGRCPVHQHDGFGY